MKSSNISGLEFETQVNSSDRRIIEFLSGATCLGLLLVIVIQLAQFRKVALTCANLGGASASYINQTIGNIKCNQTMDGKALIVKGRQFDKGFGVHSFSNIQFKLPKSKEFSALVGLPDALTGTSASVVFEVYGDGKLLWQSPTVRPGELFEVKVDTRKVTNLDLRVTDAGNGPHWDHACWLEPKLN